jgi:arylsulfatase A-like enzyme
MQRTARICARPTVVAGLVLALVACEAPRETRPPDVFMVVVDTLRADRFGATRRGTSLTPFLDELARTSTVFHDAYSTSPWTSPSVASLFTSRYPSQHGVQDFESALPGGEETLAEILAANGIVAGGFSSNLLVGRSRGFQQGFRFFRALGTRDVGSQHRSERAVDAARRAIRWIDERPETPRERLFVYLHVMDPHAPYAPDRNARARVFGSDPEPDVDAVNEVMRHHTTTPIPESTRRAVVALYDAEVSSTDTALELFFSALAERGRLDDSIVIVTADHGEELWDHGMFGHHHSLYAEVLRVPLLIRMPGQMRRRDVFEAVSLLDVAPTVLDLLGVAAPSRFEGRSLVPWLEGSPPAEDALGRIVGAELLLPPKLRRTPHERTVIVGDKQLIRNFDGVEHVLDLAPVDAGTPGDAANASRVRPEERAALRDEIDRLIAHVTDPDAPRQGARQRVELDEAERAELRALGYLE